MMTKTEFTTLLGDEGYEGIMTIQRPANAEQDMHALPFQTKALVLFGGLTLRIGGRERTYSAGDIFELAVHEVYEAFYGPAGACYLIGRRCA